MSSYEIFNYQTSLAIKHYLSIFDYDKLIKKLYIYRLELAKSIIFKDTEKASYLQVFCDEIERQLELKQ
ncbi:MAG: hypothetical protein AAGF07_01810 [Patescibacteria group bacterium]